MKKINKFKMASILVLTMTLSLTAIAYSGMGGTGQCAGLAASIYDGVPVEASGVVAEVGLQGQGIKIDTGNGVVLTIYGLGHYRFWEDQGIARPSVGETIDVSAYEITLTDGTTRLIAVSITVNGQTVQLRDPDTGMPLWRMPGK
jgi:hypothetical protein